MKVDIISVKGAKKDFKADLPKDVFGQEVNENLLRQAVRVYMFGQRRGTVGVKTRGQVNGSRRKIYRQKGTGNARHGDRYASIFVGGGVAHGPTARDWSLTMPKKMKKKALYSALSAQFSAKNVFVVDGLSKIGTKTKDYASVIAKKFGIDLNKERALIITDKKDQNLDFGIRNLSNVVLRTVNMLNTYEVLYYNKLFFTKEALEKINIDLKK